MSTISPGELHSVLGAADPESLVEQNQQIITRQIWQREPTYENGAANTVKGPPTSGARILDEFWRDSLGAEYVCITAGTPGTWKQIRPAMVAANPTSIPTGYWICRYDQNFKFYYYDGAAWVERFLAIAGGTMTGPIVLNADPSSALHAATKQYVDAVAAGARDFKDSCRAATTGALAACTYANGSSGVGATLTADANGALAAQDGVTLVANDRLLVKNQASGLQNGIYAVTQVGTGGTPFILTRVTDADTAAEVTAGMIMAIAEGTSYADTLWMLTTNDTITIGTTALTFSQYGGGGGGSTPTGTGFRHVTSGSEDGAAKLVETADVDDNQITNAKLANVPTATIKGRTTGGTGDPEDLTAAQATALLNAMVGDSGSGGTKGLAPAPGAGDAAAGKYLKADGTWAVPAGGSGGITVLEAQVFS